MCISSAKILQTCPAVGWHFEGQYVIDEDLPVTMKLDDLRQLFRTFGCGPLDDLVVETITIDLKRRKVTKKHLKIVRSGHIIHGDNLIYKSSRVSKKNKYFQIADELFVF